MAQGPSKCRQNRVEEEICVCKMERGDILLSKGFRVTQHSGQENHILRFVCDYYIDKETADWTITGDVEPKGGVGGLG